MKEVLSRDEKLAVLTELIHDTEDAIRMAERELITVRAQLNRLLVQREALTKDPDFAEEVRRIDEDAAVRRDEIETLQKALARSRRALQLYQELMNSLTG